MTDTVIGRPAVTARAVASSRPALSRGPSAPFVSTSPLLASQIVDPAPRHLAGRWVLTASVLGALALVVVGTIERWFSRSGFGYSLYAVHDYIALPLHGTLWTAWFPAGLLWLVPIVLVGGYILVTILTGLSPLRRVQRRAILALARADRGRALLVRLHRAVPGADGTTFLRLVVQHAAAAAIDDIQAVGTEHAPPAGMVRDAWNYVALAALLDRYRSGYDARISALGKTVLLSLADAPPPETIAGQLRRAFGHRAVTTGATEELLRAATAVLLASSPLERTELRQRVVAAVETIEGWVLQMHGPERRENATDVFGVLAQFLAAVMIGAAALASGSDEDRLLALGAFDAIERLAVADLLDRSSDDRIARRVSEAVEATHGRWLAAFIAARAAASDRDTAASWETFLSPQEVADLWWPAQGIGSAAGDPDAGQVEAGTR